MTKKQYKVGYFEDSTNVDDYIECDGEYLDASDVVRILKKLQEENERLKKENKLKGDFRNFINEDIVRIKKENEELSKENYGLQDGLDFYREQNAYLSEKINELEQELELYKHYVKLVPSNEW